MVSIPNSFTNFGICTYLSATKEGVSNWYNKSWVGRCIDTYYPSALRVDSWKSFGIGGASVVALGILGNKFHPLSPQQQEADGQG